MGTWWLYICYLGRFVMERMLDDGTYIGCRNPYTTQGRN